MIGIWDWSGVATIFKAERRGNAEPHGRCGATFQVCGTESHESEPQTGRAGALPDLELRQSYQSCERTLCQFRTDQLLRRLWRYRLWECQSSFELQRREDQDSETRFNRPRR